MTFLDAVNSIERELTAMGLMDYFGEPVIGIEAVGVVANHFGDEWSAIEDAVERGEITPADYAEKAIAMIRIYGRLRFRVRLERKLLEIAG